MNSIAIFGLSCFGVALLLMPLIFIAFLPMLIMWQAHVEGEKMARGAADLIEKRMRG